MSIDQRVETKDFVARLYRGLAFSKEGKKRQTIGSIITCNDYSIHTHADRLPNIGDVFLITKEVEENRKKEVVAFVHRLGIFQTKEELFKAVLLEQAQNSLIGNKWLLETGEFGVEYLLTNKETGEKLRVEADYDYPYVASLMGWNPCKICNVPESYIACKHKNEKSVIKEAEDFLKKYAIVRKSHDTMEEEG